MTTTTTNNGRSHRVLVVVLVVVVVFNGRAFVFVTMQRHDQGTVEGRGHCRLYNVRATIRLKTVMNGRRVRNRSFISVRSSLSQRSRGWGCRYNPSLGVLDWHPYTVLWPHADVLRRSHIIKSISRRSSCLPA